MRANLEAALLALQIFQVLFLALHDWIPFGRLNDVKAVRAENPLSTLLRTTIVSTAPFAVGLAASVHYYGQSTALWLTLWLWIGYGLPFCRRIAGLVGSLSRRARACASEALCGHVRHDPCFSARAQRYQAVHAACRAARGDAGHDRRPVARRRAAQALGSRSSGPRPRPKPGALMMARCTKASARVTASTRSRPWASPTAIAVASVQPVPWVWRVSRRT